MEEQPFTCRATAKLVLHGPNFGIEVIPFQPIQRRRHFLHSFLEEPVPVLDVSVEPVLRFFPAAPSANRLFEYLTALRYDILKTKRWAARNALPAEPAGFAKTPSFGILPFYLRPAARTIRQKRTRQVVFVMPRTALPIDVIGLLERGVPTVEPLETWQLRDIFSLKHDRSPMRTKTVLTPCLPMDRAVPNSHPRASFHPVASVYDIVVPIVYAKEFVPVSKRNPRFPIPPAGAAYFKDIHVLTFCLSRLCAEAELVSCR